MPELFRSSTHGRLPQDSATLSDMTVQSQLDEFVLGFRDCANESLRYLEDSMTVIAAETSGRTLIDALRIHLTEHEAETTRRRRRADDDDDDDDLRRSTSSANIHKDSHSTPHPPRRRRRLHTIDSDQIQHCHELQYPEDTQTVPPSRRDSDLSASRWKVAFNTSDDSGCGNNVSIDESDDAMAAGDQFCQENEDELRHCAIQLLSLIHI